MNLHENKLPERLAEHWLAVLTYGGIFLVLGATAIIAPGFATLTFEIFIGWLLVMAGVSGVLYTWSIRQTSGWWHTGLIFVFTLVLGLIFIVRPQIGIATLTILLIAVFALEGFSSIAFGLHLRQKINSWGWMVFSGASSLLVAILVAAQWPRSAMWAIGLLLGINLLTTGISLVMLALAARAVGNS